MYIICLLLCIHVYLEINLEYEFMSVLNSMGLDKRILMLKIMPNNYPEEYTNVVASQISEELIKLRKRRFDQEGYRTWQSMTKD